MPTVLENVRECLESCGPGPSSATHKLLVAVSGGGDSMALLAILVRLSARLPITLGVAHFNHQLRGVASDADERFVGKFCRGLGLPFHTGRGSVRRFAKNQGSSIEMGARELRYRFLARIARKHRYQFVVTAHHADDQVELFLIRLFRGAGGQGLGGMAVVSPLPGDARYRLLRPLLGTRKREILKWSKANHIPSREDRSNRDCHMLRNRIRHRVMPCVLQELGPEVFANMERTMQIVEADSEFVSRTARRWLSGSRRAAFRRLDPALQRHIVRLQLFDLGFVPTFGAVEHLRLCPESPITLALKSTVRCDSDGRVTRVAPAGARRFQQDHEWVELAGASGTARFGGVSLRWRRYDRLPQSWVRKPKPGIEVYDGETLGARVRLRHWQPGDRFQPLGMSHAAKVQDLFTNRKVPAGQRPQRVLAETRSGSLAWVEGFPVGELFKVTAATSDFLVWQWRRGK